MGGWGGSEPLRGAGCELGGWAEGGPAGGCPYGVTSWGDTGGATTGDGVTLCHPYGGCGPWLLPLWGTQFLWGRHHPCGSQTILMSPTPSLRVPLHPHGSNPPLWVPLCPYGSHPIPMGPTPSLRVQPPPMGPTLSL